MNQHFLQSESWEKFQHALGNETVRRSGDGWSYMAIVEHGGGGVRLYCPYGPTVKDLDALDEALSSLKQEAKKVGAVFVRLQPFGPLLTDEESSRRSLKRIVYSQPEATRLIDLSPSHEDLIAAMSQSKRSICRNYQKKGLRYWVSHDPADVERFLPMLHDIASRNHISIHDDDYIRKQAQTFMPDNASLHFISLDDDDVTAALAFEDDLTVYYAHAGTAAEHYRFQANTALIGDLMAYAKDRGKKWLDLFGVAPNDDPNHPWAGVSGFKSGFGGERVIYNPTFDLPVSKMKYAVYGALRTVKQKLKS